MSWKKAEVKKAAARKTLNAGSEISGVGMTRPNVTPECKILGKISGKIPCKVPDLTDLYKKDSEFLDLLDSQNAIEESLSNLVSQTQNTGIMVEHTAARIDKNKHLARDSLPFNAVSVTFGSKIFRQNQEAISKCSLFYNADFKDNCSKFRCH